MTAGVREGHQALPRTTDVRHPSRLMLHGLRPAFAAVIRKRWDVEVRNADRVPATGPVVVAANHIGFLDGPMMAIVGPRPVHALTKEELFSGPLGAFLTGAGQISVNRDAPDPRALRSALRVLRDGGVAGLFPESTRGAGEMVSAAGGAAYLALVAGAPVVPMAFLGTRLPGTDATFPPAGSRLVVSYGEPIPVAQQDWPRLRADVRALTETIRQAIIATTREAVQATGIDLPGPIPDPAPEASGAVTSKDEK
ncbi:1-acyl-sn-glycerol-3-phosphate acyltransferase [Nocardioides marmoriginsengisoli]|uniref:1-acyl-sn-glycerol-3-phosphate acyltransferase n=1 Tax=Nocardioides marmoriginsengisoli TaxID=661483 RepID=A0A3N0CL90_9ACTN|nr:lysophospholipid acyltransferase family protein [Nocardioides marmoriginsengisoli]RNL63683.1 1-acyl-sn-glycerol-3-phosphate acyltransferase [Nocardioides marmoriginsengisoli]